MGLLDVPILASNLRAGSEKATLAQLTAKSQAEGDTSFVPLLTEPPENANDSGFSFLRQLSESDQKVFEVREFEWRQCILAVRKFFTCTSRLA